MELDRVRQHELLSRLLRLSRKQGAALVAERLDQFLALMDERQAIMDDLQAVGDGEAPDNLVPFPALAAGNDEPDVRAAVGALIASVLRQDEDNERLLLNQMARLREGLSALGQGQVTARGYAHALLGRAAGRRLDVAG
jgi:hypothetical protein